MKQEESKVVGLEKEFTGLQHAIRNQNEQLSQAVVLLGQVRQELELEKSNVKRLQLEMEKVYTYLNENRVR